MGKECVLGFYQTDFIFDFITTEDKDGNTSTSTFVGLALVDLGSRKKVFFVAWPLRGGGVGALPLRKNIFF